MKLRYFIPSLVAVIAALFTGCSDNDYDPTYFSEMRVSKSYVSLDVKGGSSSIDIQTTGSWAVSDIPEWLTVAPTSGSGSGTITFSADEGVGRTAEVLITCEGRTQHVNIIQGIATVETATCAEVLAGPESKTYRVTGVCTKIVNTTYGNWYLNDGTGEVYIYGTLDSKGGTKNFLSWGMEPGDQITVEGPKTVYNGTVELVDVTVVKIEKSLIKCDSVTFNGSTFDVLPYDGGEIVANLTCKGNGVAVEIPAEAQSWLGVVASTVGENPTVTFRVTPNNGDSRSTTVIFKTTDGKKEYTSQATIKQKAFKLPKGKNPDDPFTVAEAIAKCQEIGGTSDGEIYYAKGKISSIKEISTSYGNGTFNISADGTDNNALTCYRSFFLDNQKFTDENQIAVGDEVIVCGKLVNYTDKNGVVTPEFSGNVYIYSLTKGSGAAAEGADGSKIVTVADFIAAPESNDVWYQLTGTVNNLKDGDAYGNFDLEDATGSVYVYGVLSEKGGAKKQFQDLVAAKGIKNGSKITIVGTRGSYNGKIEVMNAYFISVSN